MVLGRIGIGVPTPRGNIGRLGEMFGYQKLGVTPDDTMSDAVNAP